MKTKYLFYSLALAGMFAACTQEQLVNEENNATQEALKNRPIAGMVEFSLNEVDSRFNHAAGSFNNGETIDLYLMDELNGYYDELDANHMHGHATSVECWKYFPVWSNMYSLVDYAQTRYPFAYDETNEVWKNEATLLEGNYFAMHPSNEKITNRRDVWHYINPVMSFTNEAGEFDKLGAMDNQFWLGYAPIYRDEDRTGDMTLPLTMQPIMTVAKLKIVNNSNNDTKIDKIVFKDRNGKALPTIAYVKPAIMDQEDWRKTEEVENPKTADECGALDCNGLALNTVYSKAKTWASDATGRATARGLVQYATPAERIPYGLEDKEVAYEYVFNFEEGGHLLPFMTNGMSNVEVYFVLPNDPSYTYEPVIYGRVNDGGEWKYGILKAKGSDNQIFTLNSIDVEKLTPYVQNVTASFDNNSFEAINEVRVSTTEDLMKYLKGFTTSYEHEGNFKFDVHVYGDDLAITDEVVNFLDETAKNLGATDTNCPIQLTFKAVDRVNPATITINTEKACMKYFNFPAGDVDVTIAKGNHTIENNVNIAYLLVEEEASLIVDEVSQFQAQTLHNEGSVIINKSYCKGLINNHAEMELKGTTTVYALRNEKNLVVSGNVTAQTIFNDNTCVNCGEDEAVLTITGTLNVTNLLQNKDSVINNGKLITKAFENDGTADMNGAAQLESLKNNGTLNVNSSLTEIIGIGENAGEINVAEDAELHATNNNVLNNTGTIKVEGELMQNVKNSGYVYVINNGHVIVAGSYNEVDGIIDITEANPLSTSQAAKDLGKDNYYRYTVADETTSSVLKESLRNRISSYNWDVNPIILVWGENSASIFVGTSLPNTIARVIVDNDLTLVKGITTDATWFNHLNNNCSAVDCSNDADKAKKALTINGSLTVANDANLLVEHTDGSDTNVRVWVSKNAKFKASNTSKLTGESVYVGGEGIVEIDTKDTTWNKSAYWTGDWHE